MRRQLMALLILGCAIAHGSPLSGEDHVVRLSSLEWPPYTGAALPGKGASSALVRAAFASMGVRLEVAFFPWTRAVALIRHDSPFAAYFPEYASEQLRRDFLLSDPIGGGPLGFAEALDRPVDWHVLADLAPYRIGVVAGYVNTEDFDRRVREGKQAVDSAPSDKQNLLKLAAGRVALALIDQRVFAYLAAHDPEVRAVAARLRFKPRILEIKQLYICFRRDEEGERLRRIFNQGLRRIDAAAVMAAAVQEQAR